MRPSGREATELRALRFRTDYTIHAEGSVLAEFGNNAITNPGSSFAKITDASITLNHFKDYARIRAGQFKIPMAEEIYQQSLEIELGLRSIPFRSKHELTVFYKNHQLETRYKPDLFVFDGIVVELKAVTELTKEHEAQLFNYMRVARHHVGYLINFGYKDELQWKRFVLSDLHAPSSGEYGEH